MTKKTEQQVKNERIGAKLRTLVRQIRDWYYSLLPIDKNLIVFEAFRSTKYADSPRAIYEAMLDNEAYSDLHFVWVMKNPQQYKFLENNRTKVVADGSWAHYKTFARAKYWVVNGWIPLRIAKKSSQIAMQCWHGTPLKRLRYDMPSSDTAVKSDELKNSDLDIQRYDYLLSPSRFATTAFTTAFNLKPLGKTSIITETGYPRNDVLVNATPEDKQKFREKYNLPIEKKVILYAPTWRDDLKNEKGSYTYQISVDFDLLKKQLGDDYIVLFRAHNLIASNFDFSHFEGFIRDVSDTDDINELFIASDMLVTDYSSVFFDYAILKRPIIFYMHDIEHYQNNLRGFYIAPSELPGCIAKSQDALTETILSSEAYYDSFKVQFDDFRARYSYLEDGHATKRAISALLHDRSS